MPMLLRKSASDAKAHAQTVMEIETALAKASLTRMLVIANPHSPLA
jgi:hypothetical protein